MCVHIMNDFFNTGKYSFVEFLGTIKNKGTDCFHLFLTFGKYCRLNKMRVFKSVYTCVLCVNVCETKFYIFVM